MNAAIAVSGLTKRYGKVEVLRGLDLDAPAGSICGLLGLNGAGKTTAIACFLGLSRPDGGDIAVLGAKPRAVCRMGGRVAAVFDSPCLYPRLTVRQQLEHARIFLGDRALAPGDIEELLGLGRFRDVLASRLSLGNQRRLSLALALMGKPELVVLDEPFSGLDAGGVEDVLALITRLHRQDGASFFLASHQLPYMERICSHIAILHGGRVAAAGRIEALLEGGGRLRIRVDDVQRASNVLAGEPGFADAALVDGGLIEFPLEGGDAAAINRRLVVAGVQVSELVAKKRSLEELFHGAVREKA